MSTITQECEDTMRDVCGSARRASAGNCFVCAGQHQMLLKMGGCTAPMVDDFCAQQDDPSADLQNAQRCDLFLRQLIGPNNYYEDCQEQALRLKAQQLLPECVRAECDLNAWCRNNSIDMCPDADFCTSPEYGFAGTCESCTIGTYTCGGGVRCITPSISVGKPGCTLNKCPSFNCNSGKCAVGSDHAGTAGKYGTWEQCQKACTPTPGIR